MSKTTITVVAGLAILIAIAYYLLQMPIPPPKNAKLVTVPAVISYDGTACSIPTAPISLSSGDKVDWQQGLPFTVDFFAATGVSTGSPFRNSLNNGWQTRFASNNGKPVQSNEAELTYLEKVLGVNEFPIQQITVNGQICYDGKNNPIPGMKVIVTQ